MIYHFKNTALLRVCKEPIAVKHSIADRILPQTRRYLLSKALAEKLGWYAVVDVRTL